MCSLSVIPSIVFWDRVSLCSSGCSGIHSVNQNGLELTEMFILLRVEHVQSFHPKNISFKFQKVKGLIIKYLKIPQGE